MKRTRIIVLILSLLLIIIGCTNDTTSTTSLTTTKEDVVTTTTQENNTTTKEDITTTKEDITTTKEDITTTKEDVTTTHDDITTEHVHEYGEWHTLKSPSCTEGGIEERICSCGESETRTVEALGHNYSKWVTVSEPTDVKNGKRERTCSRCGHKEEEVIDSLSYIDSLLFILSDDKTYYKVALQMDYPYDTMVIPATYLGKPVKEINRYGIYYGSPVVNIYLPSSMTITDTSIYTSILPESRIPINVDVSSIETWEQINVLGINNSKYNLYISGNLLTELTIPETFKYFDLQAYKNCISLETVIFEEGVEHIEDNVFKGCSSLKSLSIPSTIKSISDTAFSGCELLERINTKDIDSWMNIGINHSIFTSYDLYINGEIVTNLDIPSGTKTINEYSFYGCKSIKTVSVPETVTHIQRYAFSNCSNLESIFLSKGDKSVSLYAFEKCSSLSYIFYDGSESEWRQIGFGSDSNITRDGVLIFYNLVEPPIMVTTDKYQYYLVNNELAYYVKVLDTSITSFDFEKELEGLTLVSFDKKAFYNCSFLESVTIPDTITSITGDMFYGCSSLSRVNISSIESWCNINFKSTSSNPLALAHNLYLNDELVTDLVIPNTVTSIKGGAFYGLESLTSVTIPDSVTSIGKYAFSECPSLSRVNISSIESWCSINFVDSSSNPISYTHNLYLNDELVTDLVIPDTVTSISAYAFYGLESLTSVTIPYTITSISDYTFYGCSSLKSVTIPNTVTSIYQYAFHLCNALSDTFYSGSYDEWGSVNIRSYNSPIYKNVEYYYGIHSISKVKTEKYQYFLRYENDVLDFEIIDKTITAFDFENELPGLNIISLKKAAFNSCASLTKIKIPNSITKISDSCFSYCNSLVSVTIPESIESIGNNAFYNCFKLVEVINKSDIKLTPKLSTNGYVAYYAKNIVKDENESKLQETEEGFILYIDEDDKILLEYTNNDDSIVIPDSVTSIGDYAFYNCSSLRSITIPDSVTSIGNSSFYNCSSLNKVNISNVESWCNINFINASSNPLVYAHNLYLDDELVTDLVIPDTVTSISAYAFYGLESLTSVTIPDSVTSIGNYAFYDCSSLMSITIPNNVTTIGNSVFAECSALKSIDIPDGITSIGNRAFYECSQLESITIPDTVESIEQHAFYGCESLTSIIVPVSVTSMGVGIFTNCSSLESLTLPFIGQTRLYIKPLGFMFDSYTYERDIYVYDGTRIPSSLKYVTILPGCDKISGSAFYNCSSLESIIIPNTVTEIGAGAFFGCSSLKSLTLPFVGEMVPMYSSIDGREIKYYFTFGYFFVPHNDSGLTYPNSYRINQSMIIDDPGTLINNNNVYSSDYSIPLSLKEITINGSDSIVFGALSGMLCLETINIMSDVPSINSSAFLNCISLKKVNVLSLDLWFNIVFSGKYSNPLIYAHDLYVNDELVTDLVIPDTVTSIKEYALYGCSSIKTITISDTVTSIGKYAFYDCSSLETIEISSSVQNIDDAFSNNTSLTSIIYDGTMEMWNSISKAKKIDCPIYCTDGVIA